MNYFNEIFGPLGKRRLICHFLSKIFPRHFWWELKNPFISETRQDRVISSFDEIFEPSPQVIPRVICHCLLEIVSCHFWRPS